MTRRSSIAVGFLALILVGAILLASPWARAAGAWGGWQDALFTSCSAVCVTGLSTVDVGSAFTRAGQAVVLALVEVGCLGLMTCSTFLLVAVGRRLSLSREFSLMNAYGVAGVHGLRGLILWVVGSMLVLEGAGAALLYLRLHDWFLSAYYVVMSFCNAGLGFRADSLAAFAGDPFVLFVLAAETVLGGIGFLVLYNLCTCRFRRRTSGGRGRLSLHSAVVLRFTLYLLAIAFLAFLVLEWNGALKGYADSHGLAVLAVHHTRKMGDADVFNTVSGTTGITGCADSTMVLSNVNRADGNATLSIAGRDREFIELKVRFRQCRWNLIEVTSQEELEERDVPDDVLRTLDYMAGRLGQWQGTSTDLLEAVGAEGVSVAAFGKHLAQHAGFMADRGVEYRRQHTRTGTILTLVRIEREAS